MKDNQDFLFVISPSASISDMTSTLKTSCLNLIGEFESMHSKAHATVKFQFNIDPFKIEAVMPYLIREIATLPKIALQVNGFSYFEGSDGIRKTIYAKIEVDPYVGKWFDQLRDIINWKEIIPHITIAKDLGEHEFNTLWPVFKDKEWKESFIAERLTLLQRPTFDPDGIYKKFRELEFKSHRLVVPYSYKNTKRRKGINGLLPGKQLVIFSSPDHMQP